MLHEVSNRILPLGTYVSDVTQSYFFSKGYQLYEVTKQTPWSKKISERRLRFFGHICRLPQNTPARLVLSESLRPTKKPKGRPQTTYLSVLRNQLKDKNIKTLESAIEIAQNRQFWDCICGSSGNAE